ncbi:MAG: hypothetical protein O7J95_19440 [Planctomycetota bacterium]|nr:hypothetical protein [Planctomycetota bacterium]
MNPSRDLITVFHGSLAETNVLKAALDANGFHTFIADEHMKTWNPFVSGGQVFDVRLQTPQDEAEEAIAAIRELQGKPYGAEEEPDDAEHDAVAALGRRLRWGLIAMIAIVPWSPLSLLASIVYLAVGHSYLKKARRLDAVHPGHRLTVACVIVVACYALFLLARFVSLLAGADSLYYGPVW